MSSAPNTEKRPFAVKNALVVGADPQVQTVLLGVLEPGSWAVVSVPDNLSALAEARRKAFDLIVTSCNSNSRHALQASSAVRTLVVR